MAFLDGYITITHEAILMGVVTYLLKLYIEKKYGARLLTNGDLIQYVADKGIDSLIETEPKFNYLKDRLFGKKKESQSISNVTNIPQAPASNNTTIVDDLTSFKKDIQKDVDDINTTSSMFLSKIQLEMDVFKNEILNKPSAKKEIELLNKKFPRINTEISKETIEKANDIIDEKKLTNSYSEYEKDLLKTK